MYVLIYFQYFVFMPLHEYNKGYQTLMKPFKEEDLAHQNNTTFAVVQCFYLLSPSDSNCPTNVSTSFFLLPSRRAFLDDDGLLKSKFKKVK